ncbi:MAG: DUF434 domain-containing protein [Candidatus Helarchaeota archaeon]
MEQKKKLYNAAEDFKYLLNRGYNRKSALKLVGDKYILDRTTRNILFRGVFSDDEIKQRNEKKISQHKVKDKILSIDGYNVLITLETMLKNETLIISNDGFIRDASKISNRYKKSENTNLAINLIFRKLVQLAPKSVCIFFDKPISKSGEMAALFNNKISEFGLKGIAKAVNSPDQEIIKTGHIVVSADSVILDKCNSIFDLAGAILKERSYKNCISFL